LLCALCRNFVRVSSGPEIGALYHEFFLRDKPHLTAQMFCKNARSKLAMNDGSTPAPTHNNSSSTAPTTAANSSSNSSCCNGAAAMKAAPSQGSPLLSGSGHNNSSSQLLHPQFMLPQAQLSTSLHNLHEAQQQQQYTLPPDIPLSLLEMLSKGGPSSSASDLTSLSALAGAAASSSSSAAGPVPSRLLQQSQYANLLLERQIQILQQEQAKLLMMRQAAARRQQQHLFQHDQQHLRQQLHALGSQHLPQHLQGLDLSSTLLMGEGGERSLAASALPSAVPSSPSASASASALVAAAAATSGGGSSAANATAAALELLQRDEEDRLCQLLHLKMGQDRNNSQKGTQPTNHRASAA
jgi:hypothetical protein